jgi:DNA-binding response OmpR family regulator
MRLKSPRLRPMGPVGSAVRDDNETGVSQHTGVREAGRNLARWAQCKMPGDHEMDGLDSAKVWQFEGFRFDPAGGCLFRMNGSAVAEPVLVGSRALALLGLLVERHGQLVTKDEIFDVVWSGMAIGEGNLTVQISALRRILDRVVQKAAVSRQFPAGAIGLFPQ